MSMWLYENVEVGPPTKSNRGACSETVTPLQATTLKEHIGVYYTYHVDGVTGGRQRFVSFFESQIAICVESDAVHTIGVVLLVQSRRQLWLFSVPTVAE